MWYLRLVSASTFIQHVVFLSSLLALTGSIQEFNCSHQVSVQSINNEEQAGEGTATFCVEKVTGVVGNASKWRCSSLQSALEFILKLNTSENYSCISVLIPSGRHVIDSPVHLGSTSVQLIGLQNGSGSSPTIYCTYKVDVDLDRQFDLSYVYLDYTLYFKRSRYVSIVNLDMFGCQFPLRLDTIGTVRIINSSFQ